ncbi:hypothetical protein QFZ73_001314 [Peribacillus sp. V2I11]|nr:hypothetical protein [Peribacillus sp. V2I11]
MNVDFHSWHSLSEGVPGASSALLAPVGSPLDAFFPQESRTLSSNQLCLKIQMEPLLSTNSAFPYRKGFFLQIPPYKCRVFPIF